MKAKTLALGIVTVGIAAVSSPLAAQVVEQPWHLSGQVGTYELDSTRNTRTDDVWWQVGFGRFFGDHFSLDLEYDEFSGTYRGYDTVAPGATYDQWKLSNWGLMGRYHFTEKKIRPYVAFGLGVLKHRNVAQRDAGGGAVHSIRSGI